MDLQEPFPSTDAIIDKIADEVSRLKTGTVEPGVEIARGLSATIDTTIKSSVLSACDLSIISKGIMIGAFRSSHHVLQESHKTIRLLVDEILQSVFKYHADKKQVVGGILAAVVIIAKEKDLNVQEALIVTVEDLSLSADKIDPQFGQEIRRNIPREYNGMKLTPQSARGQ